MKGIALLLLMGASLSAASAPAFACDNRDGRRLSYAWFGSHSVEWEVNHLNRMVGQVRWELGRYHASKSMWREFADIRQDVDRVNAKFKQSDYDRRELQREIERLRDQLHDVEVRLHVRTNDYYQWR
jgi:septal ring factor EnvC (AmiA/AmiB activator)